MRAPGKLALHVGLVEPARMHLDARKFAQKLASVLGCRVGKGGDADPLAHSHRRRPSVVPAKMRSAGADAGAVTSGRLGA